MINNAGVERIQIKHIRPDTIPVTGLPFENQSDCMWILLNRSMLKGEADGNIDWNFNFSKINLIRAYCLIFLVQEEHSGNV